MPLQSIKLTAAYKRKIVSKIHVLLKKKALYFQPADTQVFDIFFCLHLQVVPKQQINSLEIGPAEGIRVFIRMENKIIAAADFFYTPKRQLRFSVVHQGHGLRVLMRTLNKLEKKYSTYKKPCYPELIFFLMGGANYILIKSGKKKIYHKATQKRIVSTNAEKIKNEIKKSLRTKIFKSK